jgi:lipoprotein
MKNTIFILIALLTIISCKNTSYIEEITSERNVGITLREYYDGEKGAVVTSLGIIIPVEFKLDINYKDVRKTASLYYTRDGKPTATNGNYRIFNGDTNIPIFYEENNWGYPYFPSSIYLIDEKLDLTKEEAEAFIKKYHPTASAEEIKSDKDTIVLAPYSKFRKENPEFIEKLRKEPDTLTLYIRFKNEKEPLIIEKGIHW